MNGKQETPGEDARFQMQEATIELEPEWSQQPLVEGELLPLGEILSPICKEKGKETFFPPAIYVRKEMVEVFAELTKIDRKDKQILIGSPGVGKSVLL